MHIYRVRPILGYAQIVRGYCRSGGVAYNRIKTVFPLRVRVTSSRKNGRPVGFGLGHIGHVSKNLAVSPIVSEIWWTLVLLFEHILVP